MRIRNTKKISEFCVISSGGTPSRDKLGEYFGGSIPWVKSGELREKSISRTEETLTEIGLQNSSAKYFPKNTVLIAMYGATVGRTAILEIEATTNQAVAGIVPDKTVADYKYLFHFLRFYAPTLVAAGVGGAQPNISQGILKNVDVPLPPLPIQKQIAAILEKADTAREKRRQANQLTEQFLQSAFLEMFGDPVTNPKGWKSAKLGDILERIDSGRSPVCLERSASLVEWGVLKLGAVTPGRYDDSKNKALPENEKPDEEDEVRAGDVLLVRKNTYELVGRTALVFRTRSKLLLSDLTFRLVFRKEIVTGHYLWQALSHEANQRKIQNLSGGSAGSMPNVSKARLKSLNLLLPPLAAQQKFAALVEKVEGLPASENSPRQAGLRGKQRDSEKQLESLFNSLMQRAFKGEPVF